MSSQTEATMSRPGRSSTASSVSSTSSGGWLELTSDHRSPELGSGARSAAGSSSFLELSVAAKSETNKVSRTATNNEESQRLFLLRARNN
ncbi:hypothetical protein VTL71DRAFT_1494 [Oculimacula yallundae]|uniref:Uncharacterized protein n=1 Tax=Oculimacula yallundae TaxID=86028 RepID=A0ABR4CAW6_9HELO